MLYIYKVIYQTGGKRRKVEEVHYIPTLLVLASDSSSERASTSIKGLSLRAPATSPDPNKKRANQSAGHKSDMAVFYFPSWKSGHDKFSSLANMKIFYSRCK